MDGTYSRPKRHIALQRMREILANPNETFARNVRDDSTPLANLRFLWIVLFEITVLFMYCVSLGFEPTRQIVLSEFWCWFAHSPYWECSAPNIKMIEENLVAEAVKEIVHHRNNFVINFQITIFHCVIKYRVSKKMYHI